MDNRLRPAWLPEGFGLSDAMVLGQGLSGVCFVLYGIGYGAFWLGREVLRLVLNG